MDKDKGNNLKAQIKYLLQNRPEFPERVIITAGMPCFWAATT